MFASRYRKDLRQSTSAQDMRDDINCIGGLLLNKESEIRSSHQVIDAHKDCPLKMNCARGSRGGRLYLPLT